MNAIDADETPADGAGDLVGALDLGGASTQVATALRQRVPPQLNKKHFSVATYLGYGVEPFPRALHQNCGQGPLRPARGL